MTEDVDILIHDMGILDHLKKVDGFKEVDGKLLYGSVPVDLLTTVDNQFSYEQIQEHVESVNTSKDAYKSRKSVII